MSYKTWEKEFYPKGAGTPMGVRKAIQHSLRKWTGLLPENLEKHGLVLCGRWLENTETHLLGLCIDGDSCALCHKFIKVDGHCLNCPLYQSLGHKCDDPGAPYTKFTGASRKRRTALPMVKALQKTLERYDAGKLGRKK